VIPMNRLLKSMVALVSALGLLAFLAAPSPASGTITGGTMDVGSTLTPALSIPLGGTTTCAAAAVTGVDNPEGGSTANSGSSTGTVGISITQGAFTYNGNPYVFAGTFVGWYTSTHKANSAWDFTAHYGMTGATIKAASTTDPCSSTGTTRCFSISATSVT